MSETSESLKAKIDEAQDDIKENFEALKSKAEDAVSWRSQFERHPAIIAGIAFGGGLLLAGLLSRRRRVARVVDDYVDDEDEYEEEVVTRAPSEPSAIVGHLKDIAVSVAATVVLDLIQQKLAGGGDEEEE